MFAMRICKHRLCYSLVFKIIGFDYTFSSSLENVKRCKWIFSYSSRRNPPGHARASVVALYLSNDTPTDIRRRRMLNTSCYVIRRMRASCLRIGLEGHDYPFTADAKRGWRILNKPFRRGTGGKWKHGRNVLPGLSWLRRWSITMEWQRVCGIFVWDSQSWQIK